MQEREPNPIELQLVDLALACEDGPAAANHAWVTQRAAGKTLCVSGQYIRVGSPVVVILPDVLRQ